MQQVIARHAVPWQSLWYSIGYEIASLRSQWQIGCFSKVSVCHFDPSLSFRLKGEIFVPSPSYLLRVNSGRDLKDSSRSPSLCSGLRFTGMTPHSNKIPCSPLCQRGQEEMTVTLDSRWSLPSNVFIGGGNDRLFFFVISSPSCHFDWKEKSFSLVT